MLTLTIKPFSFKPHFGSFQRLFALVGGFPVLTF